MLFSVDCTKVKLSYLGIYTRERKYTAISRKVVGKTAHDNPERYCGWFCVHCSSKKF